MGISNGSAQFLIECRKHLGPFGKTLMLGQQSFRAGRFGRIYSLATKWNIVDSEKVNIEEFTKRLQDGGTNAFYEMLGATSVETMDISDYQGATVIHDLNTPLPEELRNSYDTVIDGGTIEHVFNVPEAFRCVMKMVRPGGQFMTLTMGNNYFNHGLYQFSTELFHRAFAPENGFEVKLSRLYTGGEMIDARDPGPTRKNGQMEASPNTAMLYVGARKIADREPFEKRWPAQGQYDAAW